MNRLIIILIRLALLALPWAAQALQPIGNPLAGNEVTWAGGGSTLFSRFAVMLLTFVGVFCLGAVLYGGGLWITSRGNSESVEKGKSILIWAGIGIAVIAGAYVILKYVIQAFNAGGAPFG